MILSNLFTQITSLFTSILPGPVAQLLGQVFAPIVSLLQGIGL